MASDDEERRGSEESEARGVESVDELESDECFRPKTREREKREGFEDEAFLGLGAGAGVGTRPAAWRPYLS